MFLDLSFSKDDTFHMFLDLCLVDGVVDLKVNFECTKIQGNSMCFDEAQDATVA